LIERDRQVEQVSASALAAKLTALGHALTEAER
jgi:hypothetical protein